jgi:hypothetical protein
MSEAKKRYYCAIVEDVDGMIVEGHYEVGSLLEAVNAFFKELGRLPEVAVETAYLSSLKPGPVWRTLLKHNDILQNEHKRLAEENQKLFDLNDKLIAERNIAQAELRNLKRAISYLVREGKNIGEWEIKATGDRVQNQDSLYVQSYQFSEEEET